MVEAPFGESMNALLRPDSVTITVHFRDVGVLGIERETGEYLRQREVRPRELEAVLREECERFAPPGTHATGFTFMRVICLTLAFSCESIG